MISFWLLILRILQMLRNSRQMAKDLQRETIALGQMYVAGAVQAHPHLRYRQEKHGPGHGLNQSLCHPREMHPFCLPPISRRSIADHLLIENQTDPVTQVAERGDTQGHHPLHAATAVQGPAQETHVSVTGQEADLDQDTGHHTEERTVGLVALLLPRESLQKKGLVVLLAGS